MRVPKLLRSLLALGKLVMIIDWEHIEETEDDRAQLVVWVRQLGAQARTLWPLWEALCLGKQRRW